MKTVHLKIVRRLLIFLLICFFVVSCIPEHVEAFTINGGTYKSLANYSGIKKFDYASKPVRENFITSDMVEAEYTFKVGSKAVDEYFGTTGTFHDKENDTTRKGFYLNKNNKGKCGVRYNKLFQYQDTWVDVKTTYMNWSLKSGHTPFATGGFCSIWWTGGINWLKEKHEFFVSGTNTPISVKGFFTFTDVDDCQGLGIPTTQIKKIWTNSKGTILNYKIDDGKTLIKSDDIVIPNKSHDDYSPTKAATATFSYQFSGKTHTQYVLDGNADNSTNIIGFESAKYIPSKIPPAVPPAIEKKVSDDDEEDKYSNTVPTVNSSWTYNVAGLVPLETETGNFYDGFSMSDTLDSCLEIKDVNVYRGAGKNATDDFTITKSGQTVTATAKTHRTAAFYGYTYYMKIKVGIKTSITKEILEKHGHLNAAQTTLTFYNTGKLNYKDGNGTTTRTTNKVTTTIQLPTTSAGGPGLNITKKSSKEEWRVGDYVDYTVKVNQSNPKAAATNVIITDTSLPAYLRVKENTFKISGVSGATIVKNGNGFKATVPRLAYGQTATITFKALAYKDAANKTIPNTAKAVADLVPEKTADAKVSIKQFDISGAKKWDDEDDNDGFRPESVKVHLFANGTEIGSKEINAIGGWNYTFQNLDKYDEAEKLIDYKIKEDPFDKYTTTYDGFNLTNKHVPERIMVEGTKTWNDADDYDQLRPNKIIITLLANGEPVQTQTVTAEDGWKYKFDNLYKYKKKKKVEYTIREKEINQYGVQYAKATETSDRIEWNTTNTHVPYAIELTKTEVLEDGTKTSTPVPGAIYDLYQIDGSKDVPLGQYTTDASGKLFAKGLVPGDYYLLETKEPYGYKVNHTKIPVTIKKVSGTVKTVQITKAATTDQREYASLQVYKKDDAENPVKGAVFGLYQNAACTQKTGEYTTNEKGEFTVKNLKWGIYYLKELQAPKGYELSNKVHTVQVGKDTTLTATKEVVNSQKRGSVELTKTDETETIKLAGAVFDLYQTDGTLVKGDLTTNSQGKIAVDDLQWGSYYFKEKKAPAGYGISQNLIRFSVNSTTGGMKQEVQAINSPKLGEIIITKRIKAADLHYDHGVPTFIFNLTGQTVDKESKSYTQSVTFSEKYVKEHTGADGYVEASTTFNKLKAGNYTCKEQEVIRYEFEKFQAVSTNGAINNTQKSVTFTLAAAGNGAATFVNKKSDWRDYSDSTNIMNMVKAYKKLTALIVEYKGPEVLEGNRFFDRSDLAVTAIYDDGTEKVLNKDAYVLLNADGTALDRVNTVAGTYTGKVSYTERGMTRSGTFSYRVEAAKRYTIKFEVNGGDPLGTLIVYQYDRLQDYANSKTTPVRAGYSFAGWYTDAALTKAFPATEQIKKDMTLYAKWAAKHLNACSWNEIKQIADSGKASAQFKECFDTVKADLADGTLSAGNYQHTKVFTYRGKTYHAMIAGFGQDTKATGGKAGISFLVYEAAGTARMNDTNNNIGGWKDSILRTVTLQSIYSALPADLRAVISSVNKASASKAAGGAVTIETTSDKLWLPSQAELYGAWGYETTTLTKSAAFSNTDYGYLKSVKGEGSQYDLYKDKVPDGVLLKEAFLTRGTAYWTRSLIPTADSFDGFCSVNDLGGAE